MIDTQAIIWDMVQAPFLAVFGCWLALSAIAIFKAMVMK
jgi:hypothetical protein